jgi:3-mercaptopyruvate sulfurtransferase SseA
MKQHGITNTAALLGGWAEWTKENLPTEAKPQS